MAAVSQPKIRKSQISECKVKQPKIAEGYSQNQPHLVIAIG